MLISIPALSTPTIFRRKNIVADGSTAITAGDQPIVEEVVEESGNGCLLIGLRFVVEHEVHLAVVHQPCIQVPVHDHRQIETGLHRVHQCDASVLAGEWDAVNERLVVCDPVA